MGSRHDDASEPTATSSALPRSGALDRAHEPGLVLLFAEEHAGLPAAFVLDETASTVGRAAPSSFLVPHSTVSRVHARLDRTENGVVLRDVGSRNGIFVDGRRVTETLLVDGCIVRIGDTLFQFVARGARTYLPYRIDGRVLGVPRATIPGAVGGRKLTELAAEVTAVARTDLSVVVHGESGTGKELVARAVHAASGRGGRFTAINYAAIPENLVESELFGFRRGAFSGAVRDHLGMIRSADRGTLLFDEIGDMPLASQPKLLRTLETRIVYPVGEVQGAEVDVRVVAATHRDLAVDVAAGRFRGDLLARLRGATVTLPPLRDRREDLYPLVRHFLAASGAEGRAVTFRFMLAVVHHRWPYNVRELAAAVKRAVAIAPHGPLDLEHLPAEVALAAEDPGAEAAPPSSLREAVSTRAGRPAARELAELLREHRGNVAAVARVLEKDRTQIHRWMQQLGLDPEAYR